MRFPDANPAPRENTPGALIASARRDAIRTAISRDQAEQHRAACRITPHSRDNINRRALRLDKIRNFGH